MTIHIKTIGLSIFIIIDEAPGCKDLLFLFCHLAKSGHADNLAGGAQDMECHRLTRMGNYILNILYQDKIAHLQSGIFLCHQG